MNTTNPFIRLIQLKQQEANLANALVIAKALAIAYYESDPIFTGEKLAGSFDRIGDQLLGATLTWRLITQFTDNPKYVNASNRLEGIRQFLEIIHAEAIAGINDQIAALTQGRNSFLINRDLMRDLDLFLVNQETEYLEFFLKNTPRTIEGEPKKILSVTLPKLKP